MSRSKENPRPARPSKLSKGNGPRKVAPEETAANQPPSHDLSFPVVGVGASAGGLDAFKKLLQSMPPDTGIAFILITHLDPSHQSLMAEQLARHTTMSVVEAQDAMRVEPNHVYVVPPNKYIRLAHQSLFLDRPVKQRGIRMSIDYFFRSLAEVQREQAICIILSGTGSDGTLGLKEVKSAGGMIMVQQPETAEFDGMPRSAIHTGMADFVLPIEEMPNALIQFVRHPHLRNRAALEELGTAEASAFRSILDLLLAQTDHDFRCYKKGTLIRRIHRRMGLARIESIARYLQRLHTDREEVERLVKDLLIGVTRFFRDSKGWVQLGELAVERLVADHATAEPIRVWVPGCATGEEAYSVAILFFEALERLTKRCALQIFATDIDPDSVAIARHGFYPANIAEEVSSARLNRFFTQENDGYRVNKRLRETCIFAVQNIVADPPFSNLDLICCRNLLIYLEVGVQQKVLEMLRFALRQGGFLFLGKSEAVGKLSNGFETICKTWRIYRRQGGGRPTHAPFPIQPQRRTREERRASHDISHVGNVELTRRLLLERYAPAAVLVNRKYEAQCFHGPLRNYLDVPSGPPTQDLLSMALEGLAGQLRIAIRKAAQGKQTVKAVARHVKRSGQSIAVCITVDPVDLPNTEPMFLVSFADVETEEPTKAWLPHEREEARGAPKDVESEAISQLRYELQTTRDDLQNTIEEFETANEDLQASNEEVMSMNEELQSTNEELETTNEELETAREELQSLNEELTTVNNQLQDKVGELEDINNDLNNLLSSTDIATIFLDTQLRIRRFNSAAEELLKVIGGDIGRPISDLAPRLNDPALLDDARQALAKPPFIEKEVHDGGRKWFLRRIVPYRTADHKIDGVVITFADVTGLKETAQRLERRERQQAAIAQFGGGALSGLSLDKLFAQSCQVVHEWMPADFTELLELAPDGKSFLRKDGRGWAKRSDDTAPLVVEQNSLAGYTVQSGAPVIFHDLAREKRKKRFRVSDVHAKQGVVSGVSVIVGPAKTPWGVLGAYARTRRQFTVDDVNFLQAMANLIGDAITRFRHQSRVSRIISDSQIGIAVVLSDGQVTEVNDALLRILDLTRTEFEAGRLDWRELPSSDLEPELDTVLATLRREGRVAPRELTLQTNRGRHVAVMASATRLEGGADEYVAFLDDLTPLKTAESALRRSEQRFEQAMRSVSAIVYEVDIRSGILERAARVRRVIGVAAEETEPTVEWWLSRLHPDDRPVLQAAIAEIRAGAREQFELEYRVRHGDGHWLTIWDRAFVEHEDGRPVRFVGVGVDITERKKTEERLKFLTSELDHRVKNALGNVCAIIRQTQGEKSGEEYAKALLGRIESLTRTYELLRNARSGEGVGFRSVVESAIAPFRASDAQNVRLHGGDVIVTAPAARSLAMALHELATNAAKYGALSKPSGALDVSWRSETRDGARQLRVEWRESGGPAVEPPARSGFGTLMLKKIIPEELGGNADLNYGKGGLVCTMLLNAQHFSEKEGGQFF